jgi:hypothetical protein
MRSEHCFADLISHLIRCRIDVVGRLIVKDGNAAKNAKEGRTVVQSFADAYFAFAAHLEDADEEAGDGALDHDMADVGFVGAGADVMPIEDGGNDDDDADDDVGGGAAAAAAEPPTMTVKRPLQFRPDTSLPEKAKAFFARYPGGLVANQSGASSSSGPAVQQAASSALPGSEGDASVAALGALTKMVSKLLEPKGVEVAVPSGIELDELPLTWCHSDSYKLRNQCPITADFTKWDFVDFEVYLKNNTNQQDSSTRKYTIKNVQRFFNLFKLPNLKPGELEPIGVLIAAYKADLIGKLRATDVMDIRLECNAELETQCA